MSFSEKLQKLRKTNNLSQEQLADMLDVTRQSVSKWESGQTYPEMDKLLVMCKIFKCSLDDLTNDEITDLKIEEKKKNNLNNFVDGTLDLIKKTYYMVRKMNGKQIIKCIMVMTCIFLGLLLFKMPVNMLESSFNSLFASIGHSGLATFLSGLFTLVIDLCYAILFILVFIYIFKMIYLDKYDTKEIIAVEKEYPIEEKQEKKKEIIEKPEKQSRQNNYAIFNILGSIATFCVKFLVISFSLPFVAGLFALFFALLFVIYLLFKGIFFISPILIILFSVLLTIAVLEVVFNFITNRQNKNKRTLISILVSIAGLGLAFGTFMLDITSITFINESPIENQKETVEKTFDLGKGHYIFPGNYYLINNTTYEIDNTLKDKIKVVVDYYKDYTEVTLPKEGLFYTVQPRSSQFMNYKKIQDMVIDGLKEKTIYNYEKLYEVEVTIYGSEANLERIKEEQKKLQEEMEKEAEEMEKTNYENQIAQYQREKEELEQKYNEQQIKNTELEMQIEEYKAKIQEYKDRIQSLITD